MKITSTGLYIEIRFRFRPLPRSVWRQSQVKSGVNSRLIDTFLAEIMMRQRTPFDTMRLNNTCIHLRTGNDFVLEVVNLEATLIETVGDFDRGVLFRSFIFFSKKRVFQKKVKNYS